MRPTRARPRVAVLSPTVDKHHGTERRVAEWVSRLADDYEIHLYSQHVEDVDLSRIVWHRIPDIPGPHLVKFLWWFVANHLWRWWDERRGGRYDLIYSAGINAFDADVISVHIVFAEFYHRVRSELGFRKNPARCWPRLLHRKLYYGLIVLLERHLYARRRTPLILIARKTTGDLQRYYGRTETFPVLYLGLSLQLFHPEARLARRLEARRSLHLADEQFVLLLIGNDWKKKGLPVLIGVLNQLQDIPVRLLVVGEDDPRPYEAPLHRWGLSEKVQFLPRRTDVLFYYAAADAYVGPSLEDTFAQPPAEAMACGLPVVTSVTNGTSEIMTDGVDGLLVREPTDPQEVAAKVRLLYEDPILRQRLSEQAARTVQHYTWERNAEQLREIFEGLMKPRVLLIGSNQAGPGGIQRHARMVGRALTEVYGEDAVRSVFLSTQWDSVERRSMTLARKGRFAVQVLSMAWRWRPQRIVCMHAALSLVSWLAARLVGARYLVMAHGIEVWGDLPWPKRFGLRHADRIAAISQFTKRQLMRQQRIQADRIALLPNALDGYLARSTQAPRHRAVPWFLNGQRILLSVSRLAANEQYKGQDRVIQALPRVCQQIPEAVYLIIGDGDDRLRLEQLAREQGISERVIFAGFVSDEELVAAYQRCELFILPARTVVEGSRPQGEGFGYVFIEAMAFGKPVVGPNYGAPTELIRHGEQGLLVDPERPEEIAEALVTLLTQPELARRMGESGRSLVLQEFTYERYRTRLKRILREFDDADPQD